MNCRYCGTELPVGALFCGECGQPVSAAETRMPVTASSVIVPSAHSARRVSPAPTTVIGAGSVGDVDNARDEFDGDLDDHLDDDLDDDFDEELPATAVTGFSIADLAFSSPGEVSTPGDEAHDLPDGTPLDPTPAEASAATARCPQCGEPMADGDVFCGECGFVVRTVAPPAAAGAGAGDGAGADGAVGAAVGDEPPHDAFPATAAISVIPGLIDLGEFPADPEAPAGHEGSAEHGEPAEHEGSDPTTEVQPLVGSSDAGAQGLLPAEPDEVPIDELHRAAPLAASLTPSAEPDDFDDPLPFVAPVPTPAPSPRSRPIPDPFPWGTDRPLREDIEATRLVADPDAGTRYVLQFSTGESVSVQGSGLVGRNPSMQPGEYVDQLVPIFDAGKSVSKTHLEFGQESGRFWVSDRYSTNGSVIRQPEAEPRRCDPGRRYFIARGTRVDVGEQFFVVS